MADRKPLPGVIANALAALTGEAPAPAPATGEAREFMDLYEALLPPDPEPIPLPPTASKKQIRNARISAGLQGFAAGLQRRPTGRTALDKLDEIDQQRTRIQSENSRRQAGHEASEFAARGQLTLEQARRDYQERVTRRAEARADARTTQKIRADKDLLTQRLDHPSNAPQERESPADKQRRTLLMDGLGPNGIGALLAKYAELARKGKDENGNPLDPEKMFKDFMFDSDLVVGHLDDAEGSQMASISDRYMKLIDPILRKSVDDAIQRDAASPYSGLPLPFGLGTVLDTSGLSLSDLAREAGQRIHAGSAIQKYKDRTKGDPD